jgi:outer membrane protease
MTKILNIILLLFLVSICSVTGQTNYAVTLGFRTGFLHGTAYELVYDQDKNSPYVSELQWNMQPLWYGGIIIEYGPKEPSVNIGFYGVLGLKLGVPAKTGAMENRDWLTPTTTPGSLTMFSSHDNHTKAAIIVDLEPGISLPLINNLSMYLYPGLSYMYFKFEGRDGYTQYGSNNRVATQNNPYVPWDSSWPKNSIYGIGIGYEQHWFIVRPGLGFIWNLKNFAIDASISVSPLIVSYTVDNHYKRSPPFEARSSLSGGFFVEPKVSLFYEFVSRYGVGLSFSYRHISETSGDIEQEEFITTGNVKNTFRNIGGSAYKAYALETFFKVSF